VLLHHSHRGAEGLLVVPEIPRLRLRIESPPYLDRRSQRVDRVDEAFPCEHIFVRSRYPKYMSRSRSSSAGRSRRMPSRRRSRGTRCWLLRQRCQERRRNVVERNEAAPLASQTPSHTEMLPDLQGRMRAPIGRYGVPLRIRAARHVARFLLEDGPLNLCTR